MITRHPYRAVGAVLGVLAVAVFLGGMIGQFNDGPWGGLPEWLGAAAWSVTLASAAVLVGLVGYLGVAHLRYRKAVR
jgi:hypothetical protein